jgi:acetyl esterase/lipase
MNPPHSTQVFLSRSVRAMLASGVAMALLFAFQSVRVKGGDRPQEKSLEVGKTFEVKDIRDVAYYDGPDADKVKHKLDLFLPKDQRDFPVVIFVHGGAWRHGDKNYFGFYSALGKMFARNGIGAVIINYRLSPGVMHPEHEKDVARAFAWTHKNIGKYGGRPDQIFISGHSAGGHLAALLATDETYLKAEGLSLGDVRGVIPLSGVYALPDTATLSAELGIKQVRTKAVAEIPMAEVLFTSVFGKDPEARKNAFPLSHVKKNLPPFQIIYADRDLPTLDKGAEEFAKELKEKVVKVELVKAAKRNHLSLITEASDDDDPIAVAMRRFIANQIKDDKNDAK